MSASLGIAATGMVTAVGLDAPSSCAALRARLDGFQETRFANAAGEWLLGAPVCLPRKWIGEKRMAHMAAAAIGEIFDTAPQARDQAPLILCLSEGGRLGQPIKHAGDFLRKISEILEIGAHRQSRVVAHGRPSGMVALDHARRLLKESDVPSVIMVGVDSYLTPGTISLYLGERRLLASDNPNGFIPGEAAAAVLCTRARDARFRLHGLGLTRETASIYNVADLALRGDGMTAAYRGALNEAGIEMNRLGYRISDLIGEQYWFKQTALASLRLVRGAHDFQDLWSPGESLGNIGAAVVPVMIGMAFAAAAKGYAAGDPVLIEASNDAGACGAAVLSARAA